MKKLITVLALTLMITAGCTNQETPQENSLIDSNSTEQESVEEGTEHTTETEMDATESEEASETHESEDKQEPIIPQAELDAALSRKKLN